VRRLLTRPAARRRMHRVEQRLPVDSSTAAGADRNTYLCAGVFRRRRIGPSIQLSVL